MQHGWLGYISFSVEKIRWKWSRYVALITSFNSRKCTYLTHHQMQKSSSTMYYKKKVQNPQEKVQKNHSQNLEELIKINILHSLTACLTSEKSSGKKESATVWSYLNCSLLKIEIRKFLKLVTIFCLWKTFKCFRFHMALFGIQTIFICKRATVWSYLYSLLRSKNSWSLSLDFRRN